MTGLCRAVMCNLMNTHTHTQAIAAARSDDAPSRPSYHAEDQIAGMGGEGQDWGGRKRGEEAQQNPRGVVDVMWETGETWAERGRSVDKKVLVK